MKDRIQKTLRKNKKVIIIVIALWIILSIVFSMPIAKSIVQATINRKF